VVRQRRWWAILMTRKPSSRLVFLDETGASTKMARRYGWGLKSQRVVSHVPHGHWKTTTFIGALRTTGLTAPMVIDGAMNSELFLAYVEQQLIPTLRDGDIVVMDNLSSHKAAGVRTALELAHCTLAYLPPYSPSNSHFPNSRRCCESMPNALSNPSGIESVNSSKNSSLKNASTTSDTVDTLKTKLEIALVQCS
jgi:hypothetical protein